MMSGYSSIKSTQKRFEHLAEKEISPREREEALSLLSSKKIALFIVAYNAGHNIDSVIGRIDKQYLPLFTEIFIIDDSSTDSSFMTATKIKNGQPNVNFSVYRTPFNRGYGGNQKLGYLYCIDKQYDIVVLLYGDGQYSPEFLPRVIAACAGGTDVVLASRMLHKADALRGGMPLHKWMANLTLTWAENTLLGTKLSEFHSGFRAYRVQSLQALPFEFNSDDFYFDTQILIQAVASHMTIKEVPLPTYYGSEVSHMQGVSYAYNCVKSIIKYHLTQLGVFYERNYDFFLFDKDNYQFKLSPYSLHQNVLSHLPLERTMKTIELGSNRGILSSYIAQRVADHTAVDIMLPDLAGASAVFAMDLNDSFAPILGIKKYDCCVTLDVVEHMKEPEKFLSEVFSLLKVNGTVFISTANIAYFPMRLSLMAGQFNYGKRGILDRTHKRLFTVKTMVRFLRQYGFEVQSVVGFAPPFTDLIYNSWSMRVLEAVSAWLARMYPNVFAYNFLVIAKRKDALRDIFQRTVQGP